MKTIHAPKELRRTGLTSDYFHPCGTRHERGVTLEPGPSGYGDDGKRCGGEAITCAGCLAALERHSEANAAVRTGRRVA